MHLIFHPNKVLRNISSYINHDIDDTLIYDMFMLMVKHNGIGLAAPQIGMNIRLFVMNLDTKHKVFINPEIIFHSDSKYTEYEGCLSLPGVRIPVTRSESIVVEAESIDRTKFTLKANGLMARCIQHEIDHLDGKLMIDYITNNQFKSKDDS